jgi:hypothetical protein
MEADFALYLQDDVWNSQDKTLWRRSNTTLGGFITLCLQLILQVHTPPYSMPRPYLSEDAIVQHGYPHYLHVMSN